MTIRRIVTVFLMLFVISCAPAQNSKQPWKEYAYPAHSFAISGPSAPNIHPDPQASDTTIYGWQLGPDVKLTIHTGIQTNCLKVLAGLKESLPKNPAIAGSLKDIALDGHPGLEYESETKPSSKTFERLYCVGERAYTITVWGPLNQAWPPTVNRMLISFRFLNSNSH